MVEIKYIIFMEKDGYDEERMRMWKGDRSSGGEGQNKDR